jgi:hypothetical protein
MKKTKLSKLLSFWRLSFKQKILFVLNILLCGIARAAVKTLPFSYIKPYFGLFHKTTIVSQVVSSKELRYAIQIGKSIRLAARYTPWNSNCLTQAMVAKFWCSLFKIPYVFYIGFAKSQQSPSGFTGHAWITAGPVAITGGHGFKNYRVISAYFHRYQKML